MPRKYFNGRLEKRYDVSRPYWFVRASVYRPELGRRVREKHRLGFCDEMNRKKAMAARAAFLERVNAGRFVVQSQLRFSELAKRYLETRASAHHRSLITNHLSPAFDALKLGEIGREEIERFLAAKEDTLAWWSRKHLRSALNAMFAAAKEWGLWDGEPPSKGVRIGRKKARYQHKVLTAEQMRLLLANLPGRLKFLVLILFGLGLRVSEALGLKWKDVDWDASVLHVRRRWYRGDLSADGENKTEGSTADLPLSASMLAEFRLRYAGPHKLDAHLFIGDDGVNPPDDRDLARFEFRPILKRLGMHNPGDMWHQFRRAHISYLQTMGGATAIEAQKSGRHRSLDMTFLYSITEHERQTAAQQKMLDGLIGNATGKPV